MKVEKKATNIGGAGYLRATFERVLGGTQFHVQTLVLGLRHPATDRGSGSFFGRISRLSSCVLPAIFLAVLQSLCGDDLPALCVFLTPLLPLLLEKKKVLRGTNLVTSRD